MGTSNYGMIWLDIETNSSPGCSWASFSHASNCAYIGELINAVKGHGKHPGIYASKYMWTEIMGAASSCTNYKGEPLWYAHYDDVKSFNDYPALEFGGWSKPTVKQFKGTSTLCNAGVDYSYYP